MWYRLMASSCALTIARCHVRRFRQMRLAVPVGKGRKARVPCMRDRIAELVEALCKAQP